MTKSIESATVVGVHEAKTSLSRLLRLVESGIEVEIRRGTEPIARLVPYALPSTPHIGFAAGQFTVPDDFDDEDEEIIKMFTA